MRPHGGQLIEQIGVHKKWYLDALLIPELLDWRPFPVPNQLVIIAGLVRNAIATRENMRAAMNKAGVDTCVTMPVPPNVTFEDLHAAHEKDAAILAFTGPDYADLTRNDSKFTNDVQRGAKGLKLHPILQRVRLNSPETKAVVEAFAPHDLPILFHAGECNYYLRAENKHLEKPEYGNLDDAIELVRAFPRVKFIVGHAGLHRVGRVMAELADCDNVWVDMSFQSPKITRQLIDTLGPERVMYASDWPWGNMWAPIRVVEKACAGDKQLEQRLFHDNAAELLKLG